MACTGRSIKSFFEYQTFDLPNSVKIGIVCMEEDSSCEVRDDRILRCGPPVSNAKSGEHYSLTIETNPSTF